MTSADWDREVPPIPDLSEFADDVPEAYREAGWVLFVISYGNAASGEVIYVAGINQEPEKRVEQPVYGSGDTPREAVDNAVKALVETMAMP